MVRISFYTHPPTDSFDLCLLIFCVFYGCGHHSLTCRQFYLRCSSIVFLCMRATRWTINRRECLLQLFAGLRTSASPLSNLVTPRLDASLDTFIQEPLQDCSPNKNLKVDSGKRCNGIWIMKAGGALSSKWFFFKCRTLMNVFTYSSNKV